MARRSWRNFDFLLLGTILALSVYGATMIYSATLNTLGVEDAVRRQIVFIVGGLVLLFGVAAVDYRVLDTLQYPFRPMTPLVLGLTSLALVLAPLAIPAGKDLSGLAAALSMRTLLPAGLGAALIAGVYLLDRTRIEELDSGAGRLVAVAVLLGAASAVVFLVIRLPAERRQALLPYLVQVGLAGVYLLDCLTLRITDTLRNLFYLLLLGALGLVAVLGQVAGGAQSWLAAGAVQPSEPAKLLIIMVLAKLLADQEEGQQTLGTVVRSLGIIALPALLVYLQPDLGTAMVFVAIWVGILWMARIRLRYLLVLAGLGLAALPLLWFGMEDYMRNRLLLFVNPAGDPDSYFNVHQALVSIGSGGWTGKGLTHGTQSQLHFLRVRHTDFIFAVTVEELGFLGAAAMMVLLGLLLWRMLRVAGRSRDGFGRLLAAGVAAMIFFQAVVNIGMNVGLLPVTGLPLPFVSYGGSFLLTSMLGAGLVESVAMRHKKLEFD
jgi:rod shape determining protein RodA